MQQFSGIQVCQCHGCSAHRLAESRQPSSHSCARWYARVVDRRLSGRHHSYRRASPGIASAAGQCRCSTGPLLGDTTPLPACDVMAASHAEDAEPAAAGPAVERRRQAQAQHGAAVLWPYDAVVPQAGRGKGGLPLCVIPAGVHGQWRELEPGRAVSDRLGRAAGGGWWCPQAG